MVTNEELQQIVQRLDAIKTSLERSGRRSTVAVTCVIWFVAGIVFRTLAISLMIGDFMPDRFDPRLFGFMLVMLLALGIANARLLWRAM